MCARLERLLPMSDAQMPARPPASVLVIDDNMDTADSLARFLRVGVGHEVRVAYDGTTGLRMVAERMPDGALEGRPKDAVGERGTGNRLHFRQPPSGLGSSPGVGGPHLGPRLVHVRLPGPPLPHRLDDVGRPGLTPERLGQFPPTLRV